MLLFLSYFKKIPLCDVQRPITLLLHEPNFVFAVQEIAFVIHFWVNVIVFEDTPTGSQQATAKQEATTSKKASSEVPTADPSGEINPNVGTSVATTVEPEPKFCMLQNPARVLNQQVGISNVDYNMGMWSEMWI